MSKIGIGVGEEFPVDDAKTPPPPQPSDGDDSGRRPWRAHWVLHILTRVAFIALVIAAIVWMFTPHYLYPGPYAQLPPYRFYPYAPHFFFFPFFPILLIALFAFAWRRRGCYRYHHHHHHWHDQSRGDGRQGA